MAKTVVYVALTVGSIVGAYVPVVLFGAGELSGASLIGGFVGAIVGLWLGWKLTQWIEG